MKKKWRYLVKENLSEMQLDELGQDEYELVSVIPTGRFDPPLGEITKMYFKREIQGE